MHKLKLRVLGPFYLNEISPSGSVRLETLYVQLMANKINGSLLHLCNLPLTIDMLQRIHATKSHRVAKQQMEIEAQ